MTPLESTHNTAAIYTTSSVPVPLSHGADPAVHSLGTEELTSIVTALHVQTRRVGTGARAADTAQPRPLADGNTRTANTHIWLYNDKYAAGSTEVYKWSPHGQQTHEHTIRIWQGTVL